MIRESSRGTNSNLLSVGGGVAMLFSVVLALPVLFSPVACSFIGSLELVVLGLVFLGGRGFLHLWQSPSVEAEEGRARHTGTIKPESQARA